MSGENSRHKGDVRSTRLNPQTDRKYVDYRDENELTDSGAVRRLIRRGIEAEEEDSLDKLDVDDELREQVEAVREDGETLDDAVRRLLRAGVEASEEDTPASLKDRVTGAVGVFIIMAVPVGAALTGEPGTAMSFVLMYSALVLFYPQVNRVEAAIGRRIRMIRERLLG
ncbi:hypothetical protein ACOJIV_20350 [Haloarcula sp. AONF1]